MGNNLGSQITSAKEEVGKKIDGAKIRLQENVKQFNQSSAETCSNCNSNCSNCNNNSQSDNATNESNTNNDNNDVNTDKTSYAGSNIPTISIFGSNTSADLLDEEVIDGSLREDIHISHDISYENNATSIEPHTNNGSATSSSTSKSDVSDVNGNTVLTNTTNGCGTNDILPNIASIVIDNENEPEDGGETKKKKKKKQIVCADDICFTVVPQAKDVAEYCVPLLHVRFCGQTNSEARSDKSDTKDVLNLGLYLKLVDKFLRQFDEVSEFTGTEEEYLRLLKLVTLKRKQADETTNQCFQRILSDSQRFVKIYHKRGAASERLDHKKYWGSRQQMLSGKVIADWIDPEGGPLDPIFGVILQPTAGRCGAGDSSWVHSILFDDMGHMAYHSAVHDAFGYLLNYHETGPGYNYLNKSLFNEKNPLSGQLSGISFWKEVIGEVEKKQNVYDNVDL